MSQSPAARALRESDVFHVARFVSIGQLPSGRTDSSRNFTPLHVTMCSARPVEAKLMTIKLVKGTASRYPPLAGCIRSKTSRLRFTSRDRIQRVRGFVGG